MLEIKDITPLNYAPELTSAGINFVTEELAQSQFDSGIPGFDLLRERIAEKAVELAFRRHISDQNIPHHLIQSKSFGPNEQHYIQMGGRRCRIFNNLISHGKNITQIDSNQAHLLSGKSFAPMAEAKQVGSQEDIYIFTSMTGRVTRNLGAIKKSEEEGQASHLFFQFPQAWARPSNWRPLGPLAIKGDTLKPKQLIITGQDKIRHSIEANLVLPPKERVVINEEFYSLRHLHINGLPGGSVGIHSPSLQYTLLIAPYQWGNLWVQGKKIFLFGFLSQKEFLKQGKFLPKGSVLFGNQNVFEDSLSLPINKLRPMSELFRRARDWEKR
ncbi:MAG: hypothetical protein HON98_13410 [Chloroflexi bacterium]|jgi:hypothetical protein|nr:hypothetical protein [Chloroflexota bacterium]MBT3669204.1 hypothetical protein [Chloroflexota bacterium]MBT4003055.1 hypothetical protein [Chloroflexota bacterium]MBT4306449.1 hypothetical protein [Chloroflexota bacterium]MBT4534948.1 hypothetical protein [Chloroflexota bacterium]